MLGCRCMCVKVWVVFGRPFDVKGAPCHQCALPPGMRSGHHKYVSACPCSAVCTSSCMHAWVAWLCLVGLGFRVCGSRFGVPGCLLCTSRVPPGCSSNGGGHILQAQRSARKGLHHRSVLQCLRSFLPLRVRPEAHGLQVPLRASTATHPLGCKSSTRHMAGPCVAYAVDAISCTRGWGLVVYSTMWGRWVGPTAAVSECYFLVGQGGMLAVLLTWGAFESVAGQ
jgi:hypothetical protein